MAKCLNCGAVVASKGNRKRLYCNDKCRMVFARTAKLKANTESVQSEQIQSEQSVQPITNKANPSIFEYVDWETLTPEQQVERWAKVKAAGFVLTGGYQMTDSERASYKPASQLAVNERNHISRPGDVDYVGAATGLLTQQAKG